MRRAWLLALLATVVLGAVACDPTPDDIPTDAEAPTPDPGEITFATIARSAKDGIINQAECRGGTIELKARPLTTVSTLTSYVLYAANEDDEAISDPASTEPCQTTGSTTGLVVNTVGGPRSDSINGTFIADAEYSTSVIAAAVEYSCDTATQREIVLCLQAFNGTSKVGAARTTLNLVIDEPNAPDLTSVSAGEEALNVDWDAPGAAVNESYAVVATTRTDPADPATLTTITSPRVGATELRVEGLTNGVVYDISVVAFSDADNPSDPSNVMTASPVSVRDFWEAYQAAGGREQGGCGSGGSGAAGLLGLAGLVALLALRRRS